jgi:hypothetical protein
LPPSRPSLLQVFLANLALLGVLFAASFAAIALVQLLRTPPAEVAQRVLTVALPLAAACAIAAAAAVTFIPLLWFWPWNRKGDPGGQRARAEAIVALFEAAPPEEQAQLHADLRRWINAGAGGGEPLRGALGLGAMGLAFMVAVVASSHPWRWLAWAGCAAAFFLGVLLFRESSRREERWREQNPFETWRLAQRRK